MKLAVTGHFGQTQKIGVFTPSERSNGDWEWIILTGVGAKKDVEPPPVSQKKHVTHLALPVWVPCLETHENVG